MSDKGSVKDSEAPKPGDALYDGLFGFSYLGIMDENGNIVQSRAHNASLIWAHLQLEVAIEEYIQAVQVSSKFNFSDFFEKGAVTFDIKLSIARILGLPEKVSTAAKKSNKVRNDIAHRLEQIVTKKVADELISSIGPCKEAKYLYNGFLQQAAHQSYNNNTKLVGPYDRIFCGYMAIMGVVRTYTTEFRKSSLDRKKYTEYLESVGLKVSKICGKSSEK